MVGIVLASHGGFADGIFQSAEMIFGPQQNLAHVILKPDEGPDDIHKKMEDAVASFDDQEQVLFIVDLWGGTPFNQANDLVGKHKDTWAIVSGMNLPMVIEALGQRLASNNAHDIAKGIVKPGKDGIKTIPEDLMPKEAPKAESKKTEDNQPKGAIAPGTVLGDGHIKHVLARVDTRLLHGQVATGWTKSTNPNRIIVVSDKVSKDNLRKNMIKQAAPAGVHAHVVPIKKMVEVEKDPRFGDTRALLLFETLEDALAAVKAGVPLKEINLGSSAYKDGKVNVTKALSFNQEDIDAIKELQNMGVKFDVRGVPADKPADINELVSKAEKLLAEKKN